MAADCKSADLCLRWFKSNLLHHLLLSLRLTPCESFPMTQSQPGMSYNPKRALLAGVASVVIVILLIIIKTAAILTGG